MSRANIMIMKNSQGYLLLEVIVAGLILTVVLLPLINMHDKIDNLVSSAGKYNIALYLAQGKIEELKGVPYEQVLESPVGKKYVFEGYDNFSYRVEVSTGAYCLKTITVIVFYRELGRENSVELTAERRL